MSASLVRVGETSDQLRGVSYGKADAVSEAEEGYLPVLRAGNITDAGLIFDDLVFVPSERISSKQLVRKGDVVIAASSGSLDVVGKAAMAQSDFNGGFGAFCKVLRPNPAKVESSYFAHYFQTRDYRQKISSLAAGANINNLKNEHLDDLLIPLPSIPEQRRIAAILDQADALRAKRREALVQLDSLTQSIFIEMFGDPVANPRGFPTKQLSELIASGDTINYGVVQPGDDVDEGIPLVRVGDLIGGRIQHQAIKRIEPSIESAYKRSRLVGDEILLSCVGSIGVVALATEAEKGFNIARAVARIRLSPASSRAFMAAQLCTATIQRYFTQELRTVSQPTLNIKQLAETRVISPPMDLQNEFEARIEALDDLVTTTRSSAQHLGALFSSLQHRAFRGEL